MSSNASASGCAKNGTTPGSPDILFPVLYLLIFMGGLLLNCLALWIFCQMANRSSFTLYLKNIVVADLLMTFTFPLHILSEAHIGPWWFPALNCRYSAVLFYTCMYASILFLGLVSLDRYLKIVLPFGSSCLYSYGFTQLLTAGVWLFLTAVSLPNSILTNVPPSPSTALCCMELKSELGLHWHAAVSYINIAIFTAVLVMLMTSYLSIYRHIHRSNAQFDSSVSSRDFRPGQNITMVLVVFFVCFVPYHLWRIPFTLSQVKPAFSQEVELVLKYGKKTTLFLSACNVCLDPIIYFLMCRSFTRKLRRKLRIDREDNFDRSSSISRTQVRRFREYSPAVQ